MFNHRQLHRSRGFSFAEVMFAVIILGVGFIMVAAMFPVAMRQTKLTVDESTAAAVARQAVSVLEQLAAGTDSLIETSPNSGMYIPLFEPTKAAGTPDVEPMVYAIRNSLAGQAQPQGNTLQNGETLWERLRGSLIVTDDPRFAWTAVYAREPGSAFVRVYIFILQSENAPTFTTQDFLPVNFALTANLQPRLVEVTVQGAPAGSPLPDLIQVEPTYAELVAEGAFVVIANAPAPPPGEHRNGLVYRLGAARDRANGIFEVDPAYNIPDDISYAAQAWIVGRGLVVSESNPNLLLPRGPAMDVAIYTTFLRVN